MKTRCNIKLHEMKKKKLQFKNLICNFTSLKSVCGTLIWDFRQSAECFIMS